MSSGVRTSHLQIQTATIVGVGLIGGSIAAALKARGLCERVLGVGRTAERLQKAKDAGLIDAFQTSIEDAAAESDLLVFCTPVDRIADGVREAAAHCRTGTIITDAGSIKGAICRELTGRIPADVAFVGSHPLAGSEKNGFEHADAELFEGRVCVVTPTDGIPAEATRFVAGFWESLGMTVIEKSPDEHDRLLALTSHMPHIVVPALATLLDEASSAFAASGFRDTTRIAGSDPALWTAIAEANAECILQALDAFDGALQQFRAAVTERDWPRLQNLLQTAKTNRALLDES